jgi:hypothetical protein
MIDHTITLSLTIEEYALLRAMVDVCGHLMTSDGAAAAAAMAVAVDAFPDEPIKTLAKVLKEPERNKAVRDAVHEVMMQAGTATRSITSAWETRTSH